MFRLTYLSASRLQSAWDIACLVEQCRIHNSRDGITGILLHEEGTFLQIMEGEEKAVEALFQKIERDPRHGYVAQLDAVETDHRLFADWPLAYMGTDEFAQADRPPYAALVEALQTAYREAGGKKLRDVLSNFFRMARSH